MLNFADALELSTFIELTNGAYLRVQSVQFVSIHMNECEVYLTDEDSGEDYYYSLDAPELKDAKLFALMPLDYSNT